MSSKGPRASASARFQCAEISHSAFRESAITDCRKPGVAAGGGAMMAMSGDGVGSGHDRR